MILFQSALVAFLQQVIVALKYCHKKKSGTEKYFYTRADVKTKFKLSIKMLRVVL